jgi:UDP-N-acetylmuramoyl-L-alanyl-D-glutamate--2,6-diaminopimelate ligase
MKENNKTTKKERAGLDKGVMSRIYIVYVFLLLIAIGIFLRIVQLQIFKANELNIIAEKREFRFDDNIEAMRGSIYSEDGRLMATSVPVFEVRMDVALPDIKDSVFNDSVTWLALGLSKIFGDYTNWEYKQRLIKARNEKNRFFLIQKNVTFDQLTQLKTLPLLKRTRDYNSLIVIRTPRREYPFGILARRSLGYFKDHPTDSLKVLVGVEGEYNEYLQGIKGRQLKQRMAYGEWKPIDHLNNMPENIVFIKVRNSAVALGQAASAWYDHPSTKLKVIGITGTNGKTSTVFLLYHLFKGLGFKTGLLSTIENRIGDEKVASTHTTADSIQINKNLAKMIESGCHYCFMELSSHAIDQERIAGLKISGAIFSNISHDHLDYHVTLDNYIKAKKKLFDELPTDAFVLVNADDSHSKIMLQNCVARKFNYSLKSPSDYKGRILENSFDGLLLRIDNQEVWCRLVGSFNAYNLLATFAVARIEGFQNHEVLPLLSLLAPVEGRFQIIRSKAGITVIVDYAHTPDALKNVLKTINEVRSGKEKLITIIGAGGDRDRLKRPLLAKIACRLSNRVILTSDNPRTEKPEMIIDDMEAGLDRDMKKKTIRITDRLEAIKTAIMISLKDDIILIAGKGHETYQEVNGVKSHFDDREIAVEYLNNLNSDN